MAATGIAAGPLRRTTFPGIAAGAIVHVMIETNRHFTTGCCERTECAPDSTIPVRA